MKTNPTTGTTIEVLAPYLPYGIEVEWRDGVNMDGKKKRAVMRELGSIFSSLRRKELVECLHLMRDGEAAGMLLPKWCLPVLRPFSQLCEPLEPGRAPVIKHVIELQLDLTCDPKRHVKFENGWIWFDRHGEGDWRPLYHEDWFRSGKMSLATAEYLRRNHFAVGLKPHQYIEKSAAAPTKEGDRES